MKRYSMTAKLPDLALTPPDDPPEPDLEDALPCPRCGCKPEWEKHSGKHHLWCHGFRVADEDLDDAILAWSHLVAEAPDDEGEARAISL